MINLLNINSIERYNDFQNYCQCMYNETIKTNNMDNMLDNIIDFFSSRYEELLQLAKMEDYIMPVVNKDMFQKIIKIIDPDINYNNYNKKQKIYKIIVNYETLSIVSDGYICICRLMLYKMYYSIK